MKQFSQGDLVLSFKNLVKNNIIQHRNFSLLILRLNGLKEVDSEYDALIFTNFILMLSDCTRCSDQAFRYGKSMFTLILNDVNAPFVDNITDRIKKSMVNNRLLTDLNVSCSIGNAYYQDDDNFTDLFTRAEQALYQTA